MELIYIPYFEVFQYRKELDIPKSCGAEDKGSLLFIFLHEVFSLIIRSCDHIGIWSKNSDLSLYVIRYGKMEWGRGCQISEVIGMERVATSLETQYVKNLLWKICKLNWWDRKLDSWFKKRKTKSIHHPDR